MLEMILGSMLLFTQLTGIGSGLPQVLTPAFKTTTPVSAGKKNELTVSFSLTKGFEINRTPPISLKLTGVPGVKLEKSEVSSSPDDPKSKDEYYVDLPSLKVPLTVTKPGKYEIPGKLVYFFCSKADGFCSRQIIDVKVPITAN
jgi:hypothetical protein